MQKFQLKRKHIDWWKQFAKTYYALQYLLIHLLFFGPVIEPLELAPKIPSAFHWEEIARGIWNFTNLFAAGFEFQSVLVLLFLFIPFTLYLIWQAKYVIVFVFVLYQLVWSSRIALKIFMYNFTVSLKDIVKVKIGAPGYGKSSSGLYDAVIMAQKKWRELCWKYFKYSRQVEKWKAENNVQRLIEWDEIEFSYKYFTTPQKHKVMIGGKEVEKEFWPVPCLASNIPVMVGDKFTTVIEKAHLEQRERLPAFIVLFLDEVGAMMDVDLAKLRMSEVEEAMIAFAVSNFFRLCRHFGDFNIVCTEQERENIYIDVRRVVNPFEWMKGQKWVLKPYLFLGLLLPLKMLCVRYRENKALNMVLARPLMFLEKLTRHVGFRRYRYSTEEGEQGFGGTARVRQRTLYLPSMLNFRYDERTYRNLYNCKDAVCTARVHTSLVLSDTVNNRENFTRQVRKTTRRSARSP